MISNLQKQERKDIWQERERILIIKKERISEIKKKERLCTVGGQGQDITVEREDSNDKKNRISMFKREDIHENWNRISHWKERGYL